MRDRGEGPGATYSCPAKNWVLEPEKFEGRAHEAWWMCRLALPPEWNFPAHMLRRPGRGNWSTHGGQPVKVVHFTDQKPWQRKAGMPGHDLLC